MLEGVNLSFFNNIMQAVGLEAAQHNYGFLTTIASTGDKDFMLQNQMKISPGEKDRRSDPVPPLREIRSFPGKI
ncbi:MAG: hypothetical protein V8T87_13605 [Victivallales bacterium]